MRVVPNDPALPALPDVVPSDGSPAFVAEMARVALGLELGLGQCRLAHVRYRPTKNCDALWSVPDRSGRALLISARLFHDDRGARIAAGEPFRELAERARRSMDGVARSYAYLPDRRLLLQLFPLDGRLPGLLPAVSEDWVSRACSPLLGVSEAARVDVAPWSYRPGHRCVLRYSFDSGAGRVRFFAKAFRDDRGLAMVARLRAVKEHLRAAGAPWDIVEPAAYLQDARLLVLPAVDGVKMATLMRSALADQPTRRRLLTQMARAAEGLGAFQDAALAGLAHLSPRDLLALLRRKSARIDAAAPGLARSVERQLRSLEHELDRLPPERVVLTHGAFRSSQLLLAPDGLIVLDLDTLCFSGASADAGNFLANLDRSGLWQPEFCSLLEECRDAFAKAALASARAHPAWLSWYRSASLVKLAIRSFVGLSYRWPEHTQELLRLAEAVRSPAAVVVGPC